MVSNAQIQALLTILYVKNLPISENIVNFASLS